MSAEETKNMKTEKTTASDPKGKRAYEKPKLRIIELTAEEVLGINCFNPGLSSSGAFLRPGCDFASTICHTG